MRRGAPEIDGPPGAAIRAVVSGAVQGVGFRDATRRRARELGVLGWVRNADDGTVAVHAEGPPAAVEALIAFLARGPAAAPRSPRWPSRRSASRATSSSPSAA